MTKVCSCGFRLREDARPPKAFTLATLAGELVLSCRVMQEDLHEDARPPKAFAFGTLANEFVLNGNIL